MENCVLLVGGYLRCHQLVLRHLRHRARAAVEQDETQKLRQSSTERFSHELTTLSS